MVGPSLAAGGHRASSPDTAEQLFLACDIGTGSVRAALFTPTGDKLGSSHVHPIKTRNERPDHYEQSTQDIWKAIGQVVRRSCSEAAAQVGSLPAVLSRIAGIGFDATCSLVAINTATGEPVSVVEEPDSEAPPSTADEAANDAGADESSLVYNVVLWMDHRASHDTAQINASEHDAVKAVRRHFGDRISPENEPGKLLHLKRRMPADSWESTTFFDLADWATWKCTGTDTARSSCTVACKWGWGVPVQSDKSLDSSAPGWSQQFWDDIGLGDLARDGFARIGSTIKPPGACIGVMCDAAATDLGLIVSDATTHIRVASPMIDAHCGALGMLAPAEDDALQSYAPRITNRLAMICGTSTCHIALCPEGDNPIFVPGVWGPFRDAVLSNHYITEGGQSATGALVDFIIDGHRAAPRLRKRAEAQGTSIYALLEGMTEGPASDRDGDDPASEIHILPDFHGNRSPRADPTLLGAISGLSLATAATDADMELAFLFRATLQALAYGTRHIVEELNAAGHSLSSIIACGGLCKSNLFLREMADACQIPVLSTVEQDAVLLGGAILAAAAASSDATEIQELMSRMSRIDPERVFLPREGRRAFHDRKYAVFHKMHEDFMEYRKMMRH